MKLLRYGPAGREKPGLLDDAGNIRDLSGHCADIGPGEISPEGLKRLSLINPHNLPHIAGDHRLGVPLQGIGKFLAVGLNYADHAAESNLPLPKEPVLFTKAISCLSGPNDDVMLPRDATRGDWEVELGVIIGKRARYIEEADALNHVAGYCLVNDVSERAFQLDRGGTWDKGKGCDTFGPVGPWFVTADEVDDPQSLGLWLDVNDRRMQTGNTSRMIFPVKFLLSYISRFMTLEAGDLICTGTPPGVGMGKKPEPVFLKPGDIMKLGGDKLGEQRQSVVAWRSSAL